MASRVGRCSRCGRSLRLPIQALAVRCSVCQAVTRFPPVPSDTLAQGYGLVQVQRQHPPPAARFNYFVRAVSGSYVASGQGNVMYPPPSNDLMGQPQPRTRVRPAVAHPPLRPPLLAPPVYGRKKALLCGVTYNDTNYKLSGSVNDVRRMRFLLVGLLGFPSESVVTLTEEEKNPRRIPTKQNIRTAMRWLVQDCQPGDSVVFYFSGHGSRQKDYNGDEIDGFDETLCPLDHETEGPIIDDEINATIVRPLPRGAKLHAIIDSCYSGTVLDLPFVCKINSEGYFKWEDQRIPTACYKGTSGGTAISVSACADHQTSASCASATTGRGVTGALTSSFIQAVESEPGVTYGRLLTAMRDAIPSLMQNHTDVFQEPQLSASDTFEIFSKQVIL